jgi:hypothetical protein
LVAGAADAAALPFGNKLSKMRASYFPGDKVTLYKAPNPLAIYYWLRQFPTTCISFALFFIGMAAMYVLQSATRSPVPPGENPETELGFFPIFSEPFVFSDFKPADDDERAVVSYIERFEETAKSEAKKYGQPASVALAQGIHESDAGRSRLAVKANNHFGEKCFSKSCKKGHCMNFADDHWKDFFKKFDTAWSSWRSHSKFLQRDRYKPCHKEKDWKGWCRCLKKQGYATDKSYDAKLIKTIEKYKLYDFDK